MTDRVDKIIAYEQGNLSQEDTITLFQEMIDDGSVSQMQGHYGRMAKFLIELGYCKPQKEDT